MISQDQGLLGTQIYFLQIRAGRKTTKDEKKIATGKGAKEEAAICFI